MILLHFSMVETHPGVSGFAFKGDHGLHIILQGVFMCLRVDRQSVLGFHYSLPHLHALTRSASCRINADAKIVHKTRPT